MGLRGVGLVAVLPVRFLSERTRCVAVRAMCARVRTQAVLEVVVEAMRVGKERFVVPLVNQTMPVGVNEMPGVALEAFFG